MLRGYIPFGMVHAKVACGLSVELCGASLVACFLFSGRFFVLVKSELRLNDYDLTVGCK